MEQAGRLLGCALQFLDEAGEAMDWLDRVCEEKVRLILREQLGDTRAHALLDEGRALPVERAACEALR